MRGHDPDGLLGFLDEARADAAAAARSRERWLRQQAAESATLTGTLLDLAEREAGVAVTTSSGRTHVGRLLAVGADFCVVAPGAAGLVYVALDALVSVRSEAVQPSTPGDGRIAGDRAAATSLVLLDVLAAAVEDRPRVHVLARGAAEAITGELVAVGADVLSIRLDGDRRASCLVAAQSLAAVLLMSG